LRLALYVNRYSMERLSSDSVLLSRLIDRAKEMGFQRLYLENYRDGVTVTAFRGRAFVSNENRHWVRALLERRGEGRVELVIPPGRVALAVGQAVYIL